ncbi:MAG: NPCBM/NEW2 domain-containing protein [Chthoniobacter sp.]|nr:NPCBM/NEW2 domain-containing protein [Chthoniobacter sp.]
MRLPIFALVALLGCATVRAGSIETFTGDIFTGKTELDFGGLVFRPDKGPIVKMDLGSVYRVRFDTAPAVEHYVPGVVLRSGVRLAAPWGPFNDPVIKFPKRNISIPAEELAWIVYTPFPAELAANVPGGQTGVLLPKGDFFAGTIKGADAAAAKLFNPIFGPRTFPAQEIHALVLRDAHLPQAAYEVRTVDGSLFAADYLAPDRPGVTIKHVLYDNLLVSAAEVTEIRAGANRCRPLATLAPMHADPADGLHLLADRGFTVAAKTVVNCVVPSGFTELVAKVAADESTPASQRMVFSVFADGKALAHSPALAAGDPPQNLRVTLSAARNVVLRVDATANATPDTRGHWIQAFFLKR